MKEDHPKDETETKDEMNVIKCFECDVMMDQNQMHTWKQEKLCSGCYHSDHNTFERDHLMTLVRSGFYYRVPECPTCKSILKYSWTLEHQVKRFIDEGEEDLASAMVEDQFETFQCIHCMAEKFEHVFGDDTPWTCNGACKRSFPADLFMDNDSIRKEFAGRTFCVACYSNDREIKIAKKLMEEVIRNGLDAKCSGCFETIVKHDLNRVVQCERLFGLSIRDLIAKGDVLQIVKNMFGLRELCETCWVNIQNVEDALGISTDRKRIEMARRRRIFHPKCHPDVDVIILAYETELRKKKRYEMFEKIFQKSPPINGDD